LHITHRCITLYFKKRASYTAKGNKAMTTITTIISTVRHHPYPIHLQHQQPIEEKQEKPVEPLSSFRSKSYRLTSFM
jgi:hypothetical protein